MITPFGSIYIGSKDPIARDQFIRYLTEGRVISGKVFRDRNSAEWITSFGDIQIQSENGMALHKFIRYLTSAYSGYKIENILILPYKTINVVTPFGSIPVEYRDTAALDPFIRSLEDQFFTKELPNSNPFFFSSIMRYSLTLAHIQTANLKSKTTDNNIYSREHIVAVCNTMENSLNVSLRAL